MQRSGKDAAALAQIKQALESYGAASEVNDTRLEAQRVVYLGMYRLEIELDQCFMFAMNSLEAGRALFPDLPDGVLDARTS